MWNWVKNLFRSKKELAAPIPSVDAVSKDYVNLQSVGGQNMDEFLNAYGLNHNKEATKEEIYRANRRAEAPKRQDNDDDSFVEGAIIGAVIGSALSSDSSSDDYSSSNGNSDNSDWSGGGGDFSGGGASGDY